MKPSTLLLSFLVATLVLSSCNTDKKQVIVINLDKDLKYDGYMHEYKGKSKIEVKFKYDGIGPMNLENVYALRRQYLLSYSDTTKSDTPNLSVGEWVYATPTNDPNYPQYSNEPYSEIGWLKKVSGQLDSIIKLLNK